jgi:hypothetical protein
MNKLQVLVPASICIVFIGAFGFQVSLVHGFSMAPTLDDRDRLIVNRLVYELGTAAPACRGLLSVGRCGSSDLDTRRWIYCERVITSAYVLMEPSFTARVKSRRESSTVASRILAAWFAVGRL